MEVQRGELVVIIGRSGSGKTSPLRALNRLNECFDGSATSGQVFLRLSNRWIEVYGVNACPLQSLRRRAAIVFQNPNVLPGSIERNLLLPLRLVNGLSGTQARGRMEKALRDAQLWEEVKDRLRRPAAILSGGQSVFPV